MHSSRKTQAKVEDESAGSGACQREVWYSAPERGLYPGCPCPPALDTQYSHG